MARKANGASKNSDAPRNVRKRVMANERERERTRSLNQALETLRNRLPVSEAEKRSKIQTLRIAKEYIEFLARCNLINHQESNQNQQQQHQHQQQAHHEQSHGKNENPSRTLPSQENQIGSLVSFYKFRLKSQARND